MERRSIFSHQGILLILFLLPLLFFGCKKEASELGIQFSVLDEKRPVSVDFSSILKFYSTTVDSILSYSSDETTIVEHLLGSYGDPVFGERSASILFQFGLSSYNVDFDNTDINKSVELSVDSLLLVLDISDYYYGDVNVPMKFLIYELSSVAPSPIYSTYHPLYDTTVLGSVQFAIGDYTSTNKDKLLNIKLSDSLANKLLFADSSNYLNDVEFIELFKGLYIMPDPTYSNNAVIGILMTANTKLSLYYSKTTTLLIDTSITTEHLAYYYKLENKFPHATLFANNYSGIDYFSSINDSIEDSILFIQGSSGIYTIVDFSDLLKWNDSLHIALNYATFTLKLKDTVDLDKFPPPSQLLLKIANSDSSIENEGVLYNFDGVYDPATNQYVFEITRYINQLIEGSRTETNLNIVLNESIFNRMNRTSLSGNSSANGNVELKLVYVKI